jgi:LPXTG-motif cell wall-anchored protein
MGAFMTGNLTAEPATRGAPFFAQSLIGLTGSKMAPSYYMIATAALGLAALLVLRRRYRM